LVSITLVRLGFTSLNWLETCLNLHVIVRILWILIKIWNSNNLEPLDNHIKFELKFKFLMKIMKVHVGMVAIIPMWWPPDWFQHLQHVEFDLNFTFFSKINEVTWKLGWNTSYLVATKWVLFSSLLTLVSNLGSCWRFMQLHEKMVKIHLIWWPLDWFCSLTYWVWCQIQIFIENLCKLHEKMVEIYLRFGGH
jgi:ribosome-associated toxin RatA of RatAB toxin-antitoxin module